MQKCLIVFCALISTTYAGDVEVSQIHLAIGGNSSRDMIVTYRVDGALTADVCWGTESLTHIARARRNVSYWTGTYVSALLSPLDPKTTYSYAVIRDGSSDCSPPYLSRTRHFVSPPTQNDAVTLLVYADMGLGGNAEDSRRYLEEIKDSADAVIHAGDISYANMAHLRNASYEPVYDAWMDWMENITDTIPYMVSVGNHEAQCRDGCAESPEMKQKLSNFSTFNTRWHMPSAESGGVLSMWYSYDFGPAHFISINTETDFEDAGGEKYCELPCGSFAATGEYIRWLEEDLRKAHANRTNRPWIFVHGHRPIHSIRHRDQITTDEVLRRTFEVLFERYKVNAYFAGHDHLYSGLRPKSGHVHHWCVGGIGCDLRDEGDKISGNGTNDNFDYVYYGLNATIGKLHISRDSALLEMVNSVTREIVDRVKLQNPVSTERRTGSTHLREFHHGDSSQVSLDGQAT